jgi:hypothetical protein
VAADTAHVYESTLAIAGAASAATARKKQGSGAKRGTITGAAR